MRRLFAVSIRTWCAARKSHPIIDLGIAAVRNLHLNFLFPSHNVWSWYSPEGIRDPSAEKSLTGDFGVRRLFGVARSELVAPVSIKYSVPVEESVTINLLFTPAAWCFSGRAARFPRGTCRPSRWVPWCTC